jgi:hypothetical protein
MAEREFEVCWTTAASRMTKTLAVLAFRVRLRVEGEGKGEGGNRLRHVDKLPVLEASRTVLRKISRGFKALSIGTAQAYGGFDYME